MGADPSKPSVPAAAANAAYANAANANAANANASGASVPGLEQLKKMVSEKLAADLTTLLKFHQDDEEVGPEELVERIRAREAGPGGRPSYSENALRIFADDLEAYRAFKAELVKLSAPGRAGSGLLTSIAGEFERVHQGYARALRYYIRASDVAIVLVPQVLERVNAVVQLMGHAAVNAHATMTDLNVALDGMRQAMGGREAAAMRELQSRLSGLDSEMSLVTAAFADSAARLEKANQAASADVARVAQVPPAI